MRNTRIKFAGCVVLAAFLVVFTYRGWAAPIESVILDDILDEKEALDQKWRDEMHKQLDEAAWQPGDPEDGDYDYEDEE